MIINIEGLRLRTIVGIYEWEKEVKQDVVINIEIATNSETAAESDQIEDTVDYKTITKKIIAKVESTEYNLIEKIAGDVVKIILEQSGVEHVTVKVAKPAALRFTDTVSVTYKQSK